MKYMYLLQHVPVSFGTWHYTTLPGLLSFVFLFTWLGQKQELPYFILNYEGNLRKERRVTFRLSEYIRTYLVFDDKKTCVGYRETAVLRFPTGNNTATPQE